MRQNQNAILLDVRTASDFANGHIPGSLFIGLDGQFAPWVGTLITDLNSPILLISPEGREEETVMRLSRVGYDNCLGYLSGGLNAWEQAGRQIETVNSISPESFIDKLPLTKNILDVRKPGEFEAAHLKTATNVPLDFISDWVNTLDRSNPYVVHCAGGYRSMVAISILLANGFRHLTDVQGGFGSISKLQKANAEIVSEVVKA